jgi:DNA helicase HerA-like ATPase
VKNPQGKNKKAESAMPGPGRAFFGEPALDIQDFIQTDGSGKGVINIMTADRLMQSPKVYAALLLWMLSELFERLPETGDPEKPKLVYFFDEAHLLFEEADAAKDRPQEKSSPASKMLGAMAQSAAHAIGSQIIRQIIRGILGSIFGSGRKR